MTDRNNFLQLEEVGGGGAGVEFPIGCSKAIEFQFTQNVLQHNTIVADAPKEHEFAAYTRRFMCVHRQSQSYTTSLAHTCTLLHTLRLYDKLIKMPFSLNESDERTSRQNRNQPPRLQSAFDVRPHPRRHTSID